MMFPPNPPTLPVVDLSFLEIVMVRGTLILALDTWLIRKLLNILSSLAGFIAAGAYGSVWSVSRWLSKFGFLSILRLCLVNADSVCLLVCFQTLVMMFKVTFLAFTLCCFQDASKFVRLI